MYSGQAARWERHVSGVTHRIAFASILSWSLAFPASAQFAGSTPASPTYFEALRRTVGETALALFERVSPEILNLAGGVAAIVLGCVCLMLLLNRRQIKQRHAATKIKIAGLETRLDEAETVLFAEPHLLIIWRGKSEQPSQVSGGIKDLAEVPVNPDEQLRFEDWIEADSAKRLGEQIAALREHGTPFNIILLTQSKALIEANGRAAGSIATLSIRALAGESRDIARMAKEREDLADKAAKYADVLEQVPLPVWIRDQTGRIDWVNKAYIKAVECESAEQAINQQIGLTGSADPKPSPDSERVHAVLAGARRALDVVAVQLKQGTAGLALDVTDLEETRNELARHIEAHGRTLDQIATAVAIFGSDQKLRFYNAAYAALWQLDENLLRDGPSDSEILDKLRAAGRLPEQADFRTWRAKRLDVYTMAEPQEDWWYLPDGQTIRVVAQQHPFGGMTYLYENVTEKLSLESRYNALISVQRETLDNLHEGVALFGSDGRLKLYNPAYTAIWKLQIHPLDDEPHIDDIIDWCRASVKDDVVWDDLKQTVTGLPGDRHELKGRINRPDDSIIDFASVPLPDGATLLTYVDVTASARIERALRERADALETADRLKTEFISHVSRELRTPLTNIQGFTDSLAMGIAGELSDKQSEYVGYILQSSNALLAVIDDILDLATIDAGVMELNLKKVDVPELMDAVAILVGDRMGAKSLTLKTTRDGDLEGFIADAKRVKQVLYNLLLNAIGFSSPGGEIRLDCRREEAGLRFSVSDNGQGIAPENQTTVFERFETKPAGSSHRGAGLGLAVVKSFVELHGGAVTLISTPGEGTTVTCHFPDQAQETGAPRLKSA